jgi:hypothetical protein
MYMILGILTIFPLGAAIIGVLYIRMFLKLKNITAIFTGVLWVLYSIYEYLIYTRVLCTGDCNIRIDLLLIYPVLISLSLASTILYYRTKGTT